MTDFMIALVVVLAFGLGALVYGHFFLYRRGMRLKREQDARHRRQPDAGAKP